MDDSNKIIPKGASPLRYMLADAHGDEYKSLNDFEKAKTVKNAYLVMEENHENN
jgi:hypothetical protein